MNPRRLHNRESFYKHVSSTTALLILRNCEIRWSAPGLFNDLFDVPQNFLDGINEAALHRAVAEAMKQLVQNPALPFPQHHSLMTQMLIAGINAADEATKQAMIADAEEYARQPPASIGGLEELREHWRKVYSQHRILCLTERWDSASMWDRYSQGHTGAVLEFACLDEHDSAWLMAKPVNYTDEPLKLNTPASFANLMLYSQEYAVAKLIEEYTHTKTTDWEPEREWRIASWKRDHETGSHTDYGFLPVELTSVILGARMDNDHKTDVLAEIAKTFPHATVWQATTVAGRQLNRSRVK